MGRQRTGRLLSFQSSQGFNTGIQGYRTRTAKLKRVGAEKQERLHRTQEEKGSGGPGGQNGTKPTPPIPHPTLPLLPKLPAHLVSTNAAPHTSPLHPTP